MAENAYPDLERPAPTAPPTPPPEATQINEPNVMESPSPYVVSPLNLKAMPRRIGWGLASSVAGGLVLLVVVLIVVSSFLLLSDKMELSQPAMVLLGVFYLAILLLSRSYFYEAWGKLCPCDK